MGITNCWNCSGTGWVLDMPCNQLGCNGAEREVLFRDRLSSNPIREWSTSDPINEREGLEGRGAWG